MENKDKADKLIQAKKRVKELKSFYKHVAVYLVINGFFIGRRIYKDISYGDSIIDAFTEVSNYRFFFWWGIGLMIHGLNTYRYLFFGKNWEQRKIKEVMEKQNEHY
ncbi:histidine kinase [Polaribacter pacificus]|uniref:Histidine kinase n=1 Tax=Polaribacter pacificus TaxID=1775173 RepID=A0A917I2G2_9FLAO|nr:2TM domain-containing protein [Polaribacter pacificus]GGH02788.1 histidine kinase [Polaribacter pacificus]